MEPTNYWGQVDLTQIPSVTAPLQAYQQSQAQSVARQFAIAQTQRQIQQQAIGDAAFRDAVTNPTPKSYAALAIARPEVFQSAVAAHKMQDDDQQQTTIRDLSAVNGYLQAKQPDQALGVLDNYITAAKAAGRDTGSFEAFANSIKNDPATATAMSGGMLAALAGPEKYAEAYGKLGDEGRAQAAEPGKLDLTAAQADQARASAEASRAAATKDRFLTVNSDQGVFDTGGAAVPGASLATGAPTVDANAPRGVRNNNPLNLQPLPDGQWAGQTGTDGRYATFETPEAGIAAADKNLQAYATHHGINTIAGVINRWSPPGENNTDAYVKTVAKDLGIPPNKPINLADPAVRQQLLQSMAKVESPGSVASGASTPSASTPNGSPGMVYKGPDFGTQALTPEATDYIAQQYISTGQLPPMGNGKAATRNRDAILNRAQAIEAETGATGYDAVVRHAAIKSATQSLEQITKMQGMVQTSEGTVQKNMNLVLQLAPKGGGPTGSPLLNAPIQSLRKNVWGSPQVASFDAAIGTVADEYAKVMSTTTGAGGAPSSDSARAEAYSRLSKAATIGQVQDVMGTLRQEMGNRVSSIDEQRQSALATIRNRGVAPASQPVGGAPGAGGSAPVRVASPGEAAKLAPGTQFMTPDGQVRVRH